MLLIACCFELKHIKNIVNKKNKYLGKFVWLCQFLDVHSNSCFVVYSGRTSLHRGSLLDQSSIDDTDTDTVNQLWSSDYFMSQAPRESDSARLLKSFTARKSPGVLAAAALCVLDDHAAAKQLCVEGYRGEWLVGLSVSLELTDW